MFNRTNTHIHALLHERTGADWRVGMPNGSDVIRSGVLYGKLIRLETDQSAKSRSEEMKTDDSKELKMQKIN